MRHLSSVAAWLDGLTFVAIWSSTALDSLEPGWSFLPLSIDPFLVVSCPLLILHFIPYFLLLNFHSLFFLFSSFVLTFHCSLLTSHFLYPTSHSKLLVPISFPHFSFSLFASHLSSHFSLTSHSPLFFPHFSFPHFSFPLLIPTSPPHSPFISHFFPY